MLLSSGNSTLSAPLKVVSLFSTRLFRIACFANKCKLRDVEVPELYSRAGFDSGDDWSVNRFLLFGGGWEPNPLSAPEDSPVGDPEDSSLSTCDDSPWDDSLLTAKSDTSLASDVSTYFRAVRARDNNLPFLAAALPGRLFAMVDDPLGLGERDTAKADKATGELNWASSRSVSLSGFEGGLSEAMIV